MSGKEICLDRKFCISASSLGLETYLRCSIDEDGRPELPFFHKKKMIRICKLFHKPGGNWQRSVLTEALETPVQGLIASFVELWSNQCWLSGSQSN